MESLLPAEPASAGTARRFIVEALHRLRCDALADIAELLVSELVTNAVLHARTDVSVRVRVEGASLRVEVGDASTQPVTRRSFGPHATTGRGLELVSALASRWGAETADHGKKVWFELDLEAAG